MIFDGEGETFFSVVKPLDTYAHANKQPFIHALLSLNSLVHTNSLPNPSLKGQTLKKGRITLTQVQ